MEGVLRLLVCDISLTHKYGKQTLDARLREAGWDGLKDKEIAFFYGA